ncbi:hypothetical protein IFM89_018097 [Coptis chinensis]|uniref:FAS1 domain-containing protein n=1 Tax=Coptis chinensis TaxID=261450 RepID=A0A835ICI2_9MAGN|nr:hypothetical protein IFM89_018097 [Coptis chinensis]
MAHLPSFGYRLLITQGNRVSPVEGVTSSDHNNRETHEKIVKAISDGGYSAMSLTLEMTLPTLISSALSNNNAATVTIFCPADEAFFSLKYPQPHLTLVKYHVSPMKIEKEDLESTLSHMDPRLIPSFMATPSSLVH